MPRLQCAATLLIVLLVVGTVGASESPGVPAHAELPRDYTTSTRASRPQRAVSSAFRQEEISREL